MNGKYVKTLMSTRSLMKSRGMKLTRQNHQKTRPRKRIFPHLPISTQQQLPLLPRPPPGVARYCFHPVCLSVCLSVCVSVCVCLSVCVCPANILVFYFSAIRRDIDLKFIQDIYRVVLNTQKNIDLHRSKVKVTGTVHCFLKVQSYHKN